MLEDAASAFITPIANQAGEFIQDTVVNAGGAAVKKAVIVSGQSVIEKSIDRISKLPEDATKAKKLSTKICMHLQTKITENESVKERFNENSNIEQQNKNPSEKIIEELDKISSSLETDFENKNLNSNLASVDKKLFQISQIEQKKASKSKLTKEEKHLLSQKQDLLDSKHLYESKIKQIGENIAHIDTIKKLYTKLSEAQDRGDRVAFLESANEIHQYVQEHPNLSASLKKLIHSNLRSIPGSHCQYQNRSRGEIDIVTLKQSSQTLQHCAHSLPKAENSHKSIFKTLGSVANDLLMLESDHAYQLVGGESKEGKKQVIEPDVELKNAAELLTGSPDVPTGLDLLERYTAHGDGNIPKVDSMLTTIQTSIDHIPGQKRWKSKHKETADRISKTTQDMRDGLYPSLCKGERNLQLDLANRVDSKSLKKKNLKFDRKTNTLNTSKGDVIYARQSSPADKWTTLKQTVKAINCQRAHAQTPGQYVASYYFDAADLELMSKELSKVSQEEKKEQTQELTKASRSPQERNLALAHSVDLDGTMSISEIQQLSRQSSKNSVEKPKGKTVSLKPQPSSSSELMRDPELLIDTFAQKLKDGSISADSPAAQAFAKKMTLLDNELSARFLEISSS